MIEYVFTSDFSINIAVPIGTSVLEKGMTSTPRVRKTHVCPLCSEPQKAIKRHMKLRHRELSDEQIGGWLAALYGRLPPGSKVNVVHSLYLTHLYIL